MAIESTGEFALLGGQPVRVWKGRTAGGVEVTALVSAVLVERTAGHGELELDLLAIDDEPVSLVIFADAEPPRGPNG